MDLLLEGKLWSSVESGPSRFMNRDLRFNSEGLGFTSLLKTPESLGVWSAVVERIIQLEVLGATLRIVLDLREFDLMMEAFPLYPSSSKYLNWMESACKHGSVIRVPTWKQCIGPRLTWLHKTSTLWPTEPFSCCVPVLLGNSDFPVRKIHWNAWRSRISHWNNGKVATF